MYIRNVDTRILYMVYTNAGKFRAVALLPGNYEINVQARGLESDVQKLASRPAIVQTVKVSMRKRRMRSVPERLPGRLESDASELRRGVSPRPGKQVMEEVCMVCHGENFAR